MTEQDTRKLKGQLRVLGSGVALLVLLVLANFYIAFTNPNEKIETLVGPIGPQGLNGSKGDKGDKGDQGASVTGEQGRTGATGPQGPTGPKGDTGTNGMNGSTGANGAAGQPGENGTNGTDGREVEMGCIDNQISWRYTDEETWRPLYASCFSPPSIND